MPQSPKYQLNNKMDILRVKKKSPVASAMKKILEKNNAKFEFYDRLPVCNHNIQCTRTIAISVSQNKSVPGVFILGFVNGLNISGAILFTFRSFSYSLCMYACACSLVWVKPTNLPRIQIFLLLSIEPMKLSSIFFLLFRRCSTIPSTSKYINKMRAREKKVGLHTNRNIKNIINLWSRAINHMFIWSFCLRSNFVCSLLFKQWNVVYIQCSSVEKVCIFYGIL